MAKKLAKDLKKYVGEVKHFIEWDGFSVRETANLTGLSMQDVTKIINSDEYEEADAFPMSQEEIEEEMGDIPLFGAFGSFVNKSCPKCGSDDIEIQRTVSGKKTIQCFECGEVKRG